MTSSRRAARELPPWMRGLGWLMPRAVTTLLYGAGAAFALTGAVMFVQWRALAHHGVRREARVESCVHRAPGLTKGGFARPGPGYYACTYRYQPGDRGPAYDGYFQAQRSFAPGQSVAIRYLPEAPQTSATVRDLAHPVVPGALSALGLGWLGFLAWRSLRARRESTAPGSPDNFR
jgi:hypothetical protein